VYAQTIFTVSITVFSLWWGFLTRPVTTKN